MKVLIVKPENISAERYEKKLDSFGILHETINYPVDSKGLTDEAFRAAFAEKMYVLYKETIDAIQFISKEWTNPPGKKIRGRMFNRFYSTYLLSYTKYRRNWEDTAIHELFHKVDNWVYVYLGILLENVVDVIDWDESVVHAEAPGYTEYQYEEVWKQVKPYVFKAMAYKKNRALLGYLQNLFINLRTLKRDQQNGAVIIEDMEHPFPTFKLTQAYGIPSTLYPRTGVHIGSDYATPLGTPVKAPLAGEIIEAGYTKTRGNYCHFKVLYAGKTYVLAFLHLKTMPRKGSYKKGATLGFTGNTGLSTGPHCHVEVWNNAVRLDYITKANWKDLTEDPQIFFTE
jgi:murein DD-endopeptidase MepM/ murein hydrolase activator NlpD